MSHVRTERTGSGVQQARTEEGAGQGAGDERLHVIRDALHVSLRQPVPLLQLHDLVAAQPTSLPDIAYRLRRNYAGSICLYRKGCHNGPGGLRAKLAHS
eukprot:2991191-Rhodomonas_salina.1